MSIKTWFTSSTQMKNFILDLYFIERKNQSIRKGLLHYINPNSSFCWCANSIPTASNYQNPERSSKGMMSSVKFLKGMSPPNPSISSKFIPIHAANLHLKSWKLVQDQCASQWVKSISMNHSSVFKLWWSIFSTFANITPDWSYYRTTKHATLYSTRVLRLCWFNPCPTKRYDNGFFWFLLIFHVASKIDGRCHFDIKSFPTQFRACM